MAEVIVKRIEFLQNYSPYVIGDILEIYAETDDLVINPYPLVNENTGILVYLNGSPVTSGILVHILGPPICSVQNFNPQICLSDSLVSFIEQVFFPYTYYYTQANHYSCAVNPPTCDLFVLGVPSITPASADNQADGSILITAQSTNTIQYKLGNDFVYDDGTGQTDGDFQGLLPGSYRIFLRDSANCAVNTLVTVGVNNTFGPIFSNEYYDLSGWRTKIEITKRGYVGSVTEVKNSGDPFTVSLRGEGSLDKFEPIQSIQGVVRLISETESAFMEIYTNDPNLYRVNYSKDLGSGYEQKCTLKVLPQMYEEDYKASPYYVTVNCTDALAELRSFYLIQADGQKYYGTISLIKLVSFCLSKLKLDLPIRVACNLYADNMDQTDDDDPFDQAYIDFECFYLAEKEPKLDFVLRSVLEPFGCCIKQWENRWNIIRVDEQVDEYDYRDFDKDGEYISNGTFDPVIDCDFPSNDGDTVLVNRDHYMEVKPGYGQIKGIYKLGLKPNILDNGDFRMKSNFVPGYGYVFSVNTDGFTIVNAGYPISQSLEQINPNNIALILTSSALEAYNSGNGGEAYVQSQVYNVKMGTNNQLRISVRYKITSTSHQFGSQVYSINVPYTKVRLVVQYGSQYLQSNGTWSTTLTILTFHETKYGEYVEREIIARCPTTGTPASGMDFNVRVYQPFGYHYDFDNLTDLRALPTYSSPDTILPDGYLTEILDPISYTMDSVGYFRLEQNTSSDDPYNIIRPDDYHPFDNPRQWVRYASAIIVDGLGETFTVAIDRIKVTFLTDGQDPIDTIIRIANAEAGNMAVLEKVLIIGSYSNLIVTETEFSISIGIFFPSAGAGLTITTRSVLSADIIYTGWLRDADGNGYEFFARDGVAESDKLHGIILKMYAAQYKRSWRMFRGSFMARNQYFGMLNVSRFVNEGNRIYMPIALTISDRTAISNSELMELKNIYSGSGSDGSSEAPFTSGFTTGFGASGFR